MAGYAFLHEPAPTLEDRLVEVVERAVEAALAQSQQPMALTVHQAASMLQLDPQAVYRAVRSGQIPHLRIGRRIRISRAALDELLTGRDAPDA